MYEAGTGFVDTSKKNLKYTMAQLTVMIYNMYNSNNIEQLYQLEQREPDSLLLSFGGGKRESGRI